MSELNTTSAEILPQHKPLRDAWYYIAAGIAMIVSFLVDNILVFVGVFFGGIFINWFLKRKLQKKPLSTIPKPKSDYRKLGKILATILIALSILLTTLADSEDTTLIWILLIVYYTLIIAVVLYTHSKQQAIEQQFTTETKIQPREEWLDQFRGLVTILLIIAAITWTLSGKNADPTNPPIGPTYLNHGWKYASVDGWPEMITIIDIGQQILMFLVGFTGAMTYYRHFQKEGQAGAFLHVLRRFTTFMFLAILVEMLIGGTLALSDADLIWTFWRGTFPNLAYGSVVSMILLMIWPKKPDTRIWIAIVFLLLHAILYTIPEIRAWTINTSTGQKFFIIPFNMLNHIPIAIVGTCMFDWAQLKSEASPALGWQSRILPVGTGMFIATWLIDFVQPAEHSNVTSALACMAIATSIFVMFLFYQFEKIQFKIPLLSDMGKNILLMYLLSSSSDSLFAVVTKNAMISNSWLALAIVGIIPVSATLMIGWILARYRIYIKF